MIITDTLDNVTSKIKLLGNNANTWFGTKEFLAKDATPLFSISLPYPMTGQEILNKYNITPVMLDDIYGKSKTLKKSALFFSEDINNELRAIFLFKEMAEDTKFSMVSRELNVEPWFGDVDIYSLTEII